MEVSGAKQNQIRKEYSVEMDKSAILRGEWLLLVYRVVSAVNEADKLC